jgi:hypothetical protein
LNLSPSPTASQLAQQLSPFPVNMYWQQQSTPVQQQQHQDGSISAAHQPQFQPQQPQFQPPDPTTTAPINLASDEMERASASAAEMDLTRKSDDVARNFAKLKLASIVEVSENGSLTNSSGKGSRDSLVKVVSVLERVQDDDDEEEEEEDEEDEDADSEEFDSECSVVSELGLDLGPRMEELMATFARNTDEAVSEQQSRYDVRWRPEEEPRKLLISRPNQVLPRQNFESTLTGQMSGLNLVPSPEVQSLLMVQTANEDLSRRLHQESLHRESLVRELQLAQNRIEVLESQEMLIRESIRLSQDLDMREGRLKEDTKRLQRSAEETDRDGIHQYFYNFSIFFLSFF